MSQRRLFPLQRYGNLLCVRASVKGQADDQRVVRLLLDTGSSFTVLPIQILNDIGYETASHQPSVSIMAAGGVLRSPIVTVSEFHCLGQKLSNFSVVRMTVPFNPVFNGILGMDFLSQWNYIINTRKGEVVLQDLI